MNSVLSVLFFRTFLAPQEVNLELDGVRNVDQPIQDGVSGGLVPYDVMPETYRHLAAMSVERLPWRSSMMSISNAQL